MDAAHRRLDLRGPRRLRWHKAPDEPCDGQTPDNDGEHHRDVGDAEYEWPTSLRRQRQRQHHGNAAPLPAPRQDGNGTLGLRSPAGTVAERHSPNRGCPMPEKAARTIFNLLIYLQNMKFRRIETSPSILSKQVILDMPVVVHLLSMARMTPGHQSVTSPTVGFMATFRFRRQS